MIVPVGHRALAQNDFETARFAASHVRSQFELAPDGKESADAYFRLAVDYTPLDGVRATSALREGIKAANNLSRPRAVPEGEFSWKLLPLADMIIRTFQTFARTDRTGALSLANTLQPKELAVAAALGVYSSTPEAGGQP